MAVAPVPTALQPPLLTPPLTSAGQHSQTWAAFYQDLATRLAAVHTGVTDGSDAAAGQIGEYISATLGSVSLTASTPTDIGSIALTAGDWEVSGWATVTNSAVTLRLVEVWVNTVSATPGLSSVLAIAANMGSTSLWAGPLRVSSAAPVTAYLGALAVPVSGTLSASGFIQARRMR